MPLTYRNPGSFLTRVLACTLHLRLFQAPTLRASKPLTNVSETLELHTRTTMPFQAGLLPRHLVAKAHLASSRRSAQSDKSATAGVLMGSAELARTTDQMEAEMYFVMDAENGDVTDTKTTDEMTNDKDAKILDTETRVPTMSGKVPPHHLTRHKVAESLPRLN